MKSFIVWLSIACSLITMNVNAEDTHYQISMQMYRVQTSPSTELEAILNKKTALTFSDEQHIILGLLDELTKQFEIQFVIFLTFNFCEFTSHFFTHKVTSFLLKQNWMVDGK